MPKYPTNIGDPSLVMDNIGTHRELKDTIDSVINNGTTELAGSTDLLGDLTLSLNVLTAEIAAFQAAMASGTLSADKKLYLDALMSLKFNEIKKKTRLIAYRLRQMTAQVVQVDTVGAPTAPRFPAPRYPSSFNDYGTPTHI